MAYRKPTSKDVRSWQAKAEQIVNARSTNKSKKK